MAITEAATIFGRRDDIPKQDIEGSVYFLERRRVEPVDSQPPKTVNRAETERGRLVRQVDYELILSHNDGDPNYLFQFNLILFIDSLFD